MFVSLSPSDDLSRLVEGVILPAPHNGSGDWLQLTPITLSAVDDGWMVVEDLCKGFVGLGLVMARSKSYSCLPHFQL